MKNNEKEKKVIRWKITKLEKEKSGLIKMRRTWELTGDEFIDENDRIINEIEEYESKVIELNRDDEILDNLHNMVELFVELINKWKTADKEKKLKIISKIVVELSFDNQKKLYVGENPLFRTFKNYNLNKWWIHRGSNPGPTA